MRFDDDYNGSIFISTGTASVTIPLEIAKKELTTQNISAVSRFQSETLFVDLVQTDTSLIGVVMGDDVTLNLGRGEIADNAGVGSNIPVRTSFTLSGDDADNYTITQATYITVTIKEVRILSLELYGTIDLRYPDY